MTGAVYLTYLTRHSREPGYQCVRVLVLVLMTTLVTGCSSLKCSFLKCGAPPGINFTGVWHLDPEMSGNPATLPGLENAGKRSGGLSHRLSVELQSRQLHIDQSAGKTVIAYDGGLQETYHWGGFRHGAVESGWKRDHFVIKRFLPGGKMLVRRYIQSDGGQSLTIVTLFNSSALTQFYELDKRATRKAFGKPARPLSSDDSHNS